MNDLGYCERHQRAFELVRSPCSWTFECPQCRQEGRYVTYATTSVPMNPANQWLFSNQVEQKKGKWLMNSGIETRCSNCFYKLETTGLLSYCPHCGAKMEEGR